MIQYIGIRPPWNDFDMLRALKFAFERNDGNSKKNYKTFVMSVIDMMLEDRSTREMFLEHGGECAMRIAPDGKVLEIAPDIKTLKDMRDSTEMRE